MIETNLIADSNIREGLKSYLEKQKQAPTEVPQFKSATVSALPGVVVPATQERFGFTDFDVFICDAAWANEQAQALVRSVVETLAKAGRVG